MVIGDGRIVPFPGGLELPEDVHNGDDPAPTGGGGSSGRLAVMGLLAMLASAIALTGRGR